MTPTLDQFLALLSESGMSDREASLRLGCDPKYVNRVRRGNVDFRPVHYYALRGLITEKAMTTTMPNPVLTTIAAVEKHWGSTRDEWGLVADDAADDEQVRFAPREEYPGRYVFEVVDRYGDWQRVGDETFGPEEVPGVVTQEGHTMQEAHALLADAFREAFPDENFRAGESESWSAGLADWLSGGDWRSLPTMDALRREYIDTVREIIDARRS
jgi:hypothetical protein